MALNRLNTLIAVLAICIPTFSQYDTSLPSPDTQTSTQCKGIVKSTCVRCKNKTTNANGYCNYHQDQALGETTKSTQTTKTSGSSVQCKGIAKSTGVRSKNKTTNKNGYCSAHQSQATGYKAPAKTSYVGRCQARTKAD